MPPVIFEYLGLAPQINDAGKIGSQIGGTVGLLTAGGIGMEIGEMARAILGELIYQYGVAYIDSLKGSYS